MTPLAADGVAGRRLLMQKAITWYMIDTETSLSIRLLAVLRRMQLDDYLSYKFRSKQNAALSSCGYFFPLEKFSVFHDTFCVLNLFTGF